MTESNLRIPLLIVSIGLFILFTGLGLGVLSEEVFTHGANAYKTISNTNNKNSCKEMLFLNASIHQAVECNHGDHKVVMVGRDLCCKCE